jgi:hypothetical protein
MSEQIPEMTDRQREVARLQEQWQEEERAKLLVEVHAYLDRNPEIRDKWRARQRASMARYRAKHPEAQAKRVAAQSAKRRDERARRSNRDLIGG